MSSTRLPGKVLADLAGKPALERMIERVRRAPSLDGIVVATTDRAADDPVAALAARLGAACFRGSEDDVLDRVLNAALAHQVDVIVELTGDCPLIDPEIVEAVIGAYASGGADYVSNVLQRSYPIGMDTQVFATGVLADVARRTNDAADREHVSLFIYRHPELYRLRNVDAPEALRRPELRLTLDTAEDLRLIRAVFEGLLPSDRCFGLAKILAYLDAHPQLVAINAAVPHRHVRVAI